MNAILKKIVVRHRYTMSGSYCCYYSRHAILVTTVVTAVVTENRMPTHAIFILMSDARCLALFLRKNRPSWTTTRRSTQHSPAQKSGQSSDNEHTFSRIRHHCHDNWNVLGVRGVLSHRRNRSKPRVFSRAAGVCSDDGSGEMRL